MSGVEYAASADINRLKRMYGYGSHWIMLNRNNVLTMTQMTKMPDWIIRNFQEPMKDATLSAIMSEVERFSA